MTLLRHGPLLARALARRAAVRRRERWPREWLERYQRSRVGEMVAHASRHSRFYRRLYGGPIAPHAIRLESLPAISKTDWMAGFDEVVTDGRLRRDAIRAHLEGLKGDDTYLGEYRVMASSGTTGIPGLYVWNRRDWLSLLVVAMRVADRLGYGPRWPRLRVVNIAPPSPRHMSYRLSQSLDVGVTRRHRLDATMSLDALVDAVGRLEPDILTAYPSILAALASAQLDGTLDIRPRAVSVSGEVCTRDMHARIQAAWGAAPYDVYAMSEAGVVAVSCEHGALHAHEDAAVLEPVDAALRPVPPGVAGEKLLVTSLLNRTQPVIRLEVSDRFAWGVAPCACGRTLRRIEAFDGRADDMLVLPRASDGSSVSLHPVQLRSLLGGVAGLDGYQVTLDANTLMIDILTREADLAERLRRRVSAALRHRDIQTVAVRVARVDELVRERSGKIKLVRKRSRDDEWRR